MGGDEIPGTVEVGWSAEFSLTVYTSATPEQLRDLMQKPIFDDRRTRMDELAEPAV